MKVSEVFIPAGMPTYTYNPRDQLELENQFRDYLETGYKLLSLTGPTKSGKTVLCRQLIPKEQGIWVSGGEIRCENNFWQSIIDNLGLYTSTTFEYRRGRLQTVGTEVMGKVSTFVAEVNGKVNGSESKSNQEAQTLSKYESPRSVAIKALNRQNKPIIIDDFHYIPEPIQTHIVRSLKNPIFDGLRLVLISVPHRAYDTVKVESEMTGRVQQLNITSWTENELMEISGKGFPLLNIQPNPGADKIFASESFGSPQLMQEFCLNICKIHNIKESREQPAKITGEPKNIFFERIAESITSKTDFELLAKGPRARDRNQREFNDGRQGDIYLSILTATANTGPKTEIQYEEIRSKLRSMLKDEIPQRHEISRALVKMEEISLKSPGTPKILEWDKRDAILYILDPYFAFYMRWKVRDHTQQEHLP
jgi:hypothetical protein